MMARFFIDLSYDGRNFSGWQEQANTKNTVQAVLQEKMALVLREPVAVTGCGRTDAGVSARTFYGHFDSSSKDLPSLVFKLNQVLPPSVAINRILRVTPDAHARYNATERVYHYFVHTHKNPFRCAFSTYVEPAVRFEEMNEAAGVLLRHHDFTSFSKLRTQNKTNVCKVTEARWLQCGPNEWKFIIRADRFLRGMVRAIVGSLLLVGRGKITFAEFEKMIIARNRNAAGSNAPAHALFLTGVRYPNEIFK